MTGSSYSPELNNDELLYSWVGRFAEHNADEDAKDLMYMLLGSRNAILSVDLPCGIDRIEHALGPKFPYANANDAIERGT